LYFGRRRERGTTIEVTSIADVSVPLLRKIVVGLVG
jgi:hypothetical protein